MVDRQTIIVADRQTNRQKNEQTQTDKQTGQQTDRQTNKQKSPSPSSSSSSTSFLFFKFEAQIASPKNHFYWPDRSFAFRRELKITFFEFNHKTWTLSYNIYYEMQIFEPKHSSSSGKRYKWTQNGQIKSREIMPTLQQSNFHSNKIIIIIWYMV